MSDNGDDTLFVEPRDQGGYAVRKSNAKRASAVEATQADAIARAKELNPDASIHVARVRHTPGGGPDKFRKIK